MYKTRHKGSTLGPLLIITKKERRRVSNFETRLVPLLIYFLDCCFNSIAIVTADYFLVHLDTRFEWLEAGL